MNKNQSVEFYFDRWLASTAEMDADCRGWYLNLMLHNHIKGTLPFIMEKLAAICNVKFSEYKRFEQVFTEVLQYLFEQAPDEKNDKRIRLVDISLLIKPREEYKEKRSGAGKMSYLMRYFYKNYPDGIAKNLNLRDFIKNNIDLSVDTKNEQVVKQVFEKLLESYKNQIGNTQNLSMSSENIEKLFIKPTINEIRDYCAERNNNVNAEHFYNFYNKKGWTVGITPMQDWKASIAVWEKTPHAFPAPKANLSFDVVYPNRPKQ